MALALCSLLFALGFKQPAQYVVYRYCALVRPSKRAAFSFKHTNAPYRVRHNTNYGLPRWLNLSKFQLNNFSILSTAPANSTIVGKAITVPCHKDFRSDFKGAGFDNSFVKAS